MNGSGRYRARMVLPPRRVVRALLRLPRPLARLLAGRSRRGDAGQALDRQVRLLLWAEALVGIPPLTGAAVAPSRARFRRTSRRLVADAPAHERRDLVLRGPAGLLRARSFAPPGLGPRSGGLVWLHGGGWVLGDLDTHEAVCADLAVRAGCRVIAVDYRLAPEHPFPAAVEDAWAAFREVLSRADELGLDPARVAVGGDSAGGNLAAVVALLARDAGGPAPAGQVLVYPGLDNSPRRTASEERFGRGYLLSEADIAWFRAHYLPRAEDRLDWRASPLLVPDLRGVAPAVVIAAGFDPIQDGAREYAARLRQSGVRVEERCEADLVHGFLHLTAGVRAARRAADALAGSVRALLAPAR